MIIGLFPSFTNVTGGVQVSGREAWSGLLAHFGRDQTHLISHQPNSSKLRTVLAAGACGRRRGLVLIWHLGLLKLLPLVDPSLSRSVVFLHGIEAWRPIGGIAQGLLRRSRLILTNSDHTWARFLESNPSFRSCKHRTVYLGLGVADSERVKPAGRPQVVMVGRLERDEAYKGHREVIGAWPEVIRRVPGAELVIVGDGNLRPDLQTFARGLDLSGSVCFLGEIPESEKAKAIARARCLALPSRGEGFGLVYLEAMRVGRPCLVSSFDAGREVVDPPHAGLSVDPSNSERLAQVLCQLIAQDAAWNAMSEQARRRYEEVFTVSAFRQRLIAAVRSTGLVGDPN